MIKFSCFLIAQFGICILSLGQTQQNDTLYVESVNFYTETTMSVSCLSFEESFGKSIKFDVLTNKDTLAILNSFLSNVRYARKSQDLDVRAKFIYEKSDGTKWKICMSRFDILIDNRLIKGDKRFFMFLKGLTML
jgi:hypothetical protein